MHSCQNSDLIQGSLIGGSIGDALGAPIEFMSLETIKQTYGSEGIRDFVPAFGRLGAITDDTQMTLFTAEGLLRAYVRSRSRGICNVPRVVLSAYRRWLETQEGAFQSRDKNSPGWLYHVEALWALREPGATCLSALREQQEGHEPANNDRKGAGGIMRIGPVAMMFAGQLDREQEVFELASNCAWLTHGHPTGYLASAAFAVILYAVLCHKSLDDGIAMAENLLQTVDGSEEVLSAMRLAQELAQRDLPSQKAIAQIGEAWVAEEALGVAIYCSMKAKDFYSGVLVAVNHAGDSDTTGLLTGQLLGGMFGFASIPKHWVDQLELKDEIRQIGQDLIDHRDWETDFGISPSIIYRYPGM